MKKLFMLLMGLSLGVAAETLQVTATQNCNLSELLTVDQINDIKANVYEAVEVLGAFEVTNNVTLTGFTGQWSQASKVTAVTVADAFGSADPVAFTYAGQVQFWAADAVWANNFTFAGGYLRICSGETFNGTISSSKNFDIWRSKDGTTNQHGIFNGAVTVAGALGIHPGNVGSEKYLKFYGAVTATKLTGGTSETMHGYAY